MKLLLLLVLVRPIWAQGSLRGTVTDPAGAAVPNAVVQLTGPGGDRRVKTTIGGEYSFSRLVPGKHLLRVSAKSFTPVRKEIELSGAAVFDVRLSIQATRQAVNVEGRTGRVSTEPADNGNAVVMREQQIGALSDDPDELALELQALAGPAPGPNGGQLYVDGFSGASLPQKSSIHEVRVNSNPYSPEYDRAGFSRVEIFTKPGSESLHGHAMSQQNSDVLDSRSPLLAQAAPYRSQLYSFDLSGPLKKNRASFTLDLQVRKIDDHAFILATLPDASLNETLPTPQARTVVSPRFDYAVNDKNQLTARYQQVWNSLDNLGVGDFNLPSRAYHESQQEQTLQISETATLSPRAIHEIRFQYLRSSIWDTAKVDAPAIDVVGAFSGGGAPVGNSGTLTGNWELSDIATFKKGNHTLKWGGRARDSRLSDASNDNFAGTFTFYTLAQYEAGLPSQFSRNAGTPTARVSQTDVGAFAGDDWRVRPNLTFSFGLRYETQTNFGGRRDFAPRLGMAWSKGKTVLRIGAGSFYDRIPLAVKLNQLRYNGVTQQSYLILDPSFYPAAPSVTDLAARPQQLRPVAAGLIASRLYQSSAAVERQLNRQSRVALTWIETRGVHLANSRNINTPVNGAYPFGDPSIRLLTESSGESRQRQLIANTNVNWRHLTLFGFYALSYGKDDNEGQPADPYNLRAEWGPSTYGDVRHRAAVGATVPLPWRVSVSPFVVANSGLPYNITTGLDPLDTGYPAQRPGTPEIERNSGRGPANFNVALRVGKTWELGRHADRRTTRQLTLSASTLNALNRANYAPPDGDMSSVYFGHYRSLGGLIVMAHGGAPNTYNRKIDVQLQFAF